MGTRYARTVGRLLGLATLLLLALSSPAGAATFIVDNGGDGHDRDTLDAVCDAAPSGETPFCTLRAAVEQSNAADDEDLVSVQVSDVALTLAGGGAIEIDKDVTIQGVSADSTAIFQELSPGSGDRVFDIAVGAKVTLDALTIRAGEAHSGNNYFGGNIRSAGTLHDPKQQHHGRGGRFRGRGGERRRVADGRTEHVHPQRRPLVALRGR